MDNLDTLRDHGFFSTIMPRYTSYPPANYFAARIGAQYRNYWLKMSGIARVADGFFSATVSQSSAI